MDIDIRIDGPSHDGIYRGQCPALPGCIVYGCSREEARIRCHDAVDDYLEHMDVVLPQELARLWRQVRQSRVPKRSLPVHTGLV